MSNVFACTARAFRWYADGTESGATALEAENGVFCARANSGNVQLVLRYGIQESGAGSISGATTDDYQLQYSKNGGTYTSITTATSNIKAWASSNLTDAGTTTNRLSAGTGSFVAGEISETGLVTDRQLTANNFTEMLYTVEVIAADVAEGDVFDFRVLLNGGVFAAYTVTPRLVVTKVALVDATSSHVLPVTSGEWTTLLSGTGLSNPSQVFGFQQSASPAASVMGTSSPLSQVGSTHVNQASVTGWTRKGINQTSVPSTAAVFGDVSPLNYATKSCLLLLIVRPGNASPNGGVDAIVSFNSSDIAALSMITGSSGPKLRAHHFINATTTVDGTVEYTGNSLVVVLQYNVTASQIAVHTASEVLKPTWSGSPTGTSRITFGNSSSGLGAISSTPLLYAAVWDGSAAEMSDSNVQVLLGKIAGVRTLVATTGNVPITGTNASLERNTVLVAATGNVPITGSNATLSYAKKLTATTGNVPITGTDASLEFNRIFTAATGNVPITGTNASLERNTVLVAATGNVPITGSDASLERNTLLAATTGNVPISGSNASLQYNRRFTATTGNVPITGSDASLEANRVLVATTDNVPITGSDATLTYNENEDAIALVADTGNVPISGSDASLERNARLVADTGNVPITGTDASLERNAVLVAATGNVPITGSNASLVKTRLLAADTGNVPISGSNASFRHNHALNADTGNVPISGSNASLQYNRRFAAATDNVPITGNDANFLKATRLAADTGNVPITGSNATFRKDYRLNSATGNVPISGSNATLARAPRLTADTGNIPISGSNADLRPNRRLLAATDNVPIAGASATFLRNRVLNAASGNVPITGPSADLFYSGAFEPVSWESVTVRRGTDEYD